MAAWAAFWIGAIASSCQAQEQAWEREVPQALTAPLIDGQLGKEEWAGAAVIEDFRQVEPISGGKVSERTTLRLLVDRDNLYIGIECWDSDPSGIVRTQMVRDAQLDPDDRVELVLDTFLDRRNAFFFQINPSGSKGDALIENNGSFFSKDWDGIWEGKASVDERGWHAELAIPAKTVGMGEGHHSFGFNARRYIRRKNEVLEWANPLRTRPLFQIASSGTLHGMDVLEQGVGLDFTPFTTIKIGRDRERDRTIFDLEPGFDLRYRITPSLAATLTYNTDFAEVEVDSRVVNLSRFPVFFPEKRDFFLQDAGIFSFAGLRRSLLPFFSRRIGLAPDGSPLPILGGAKLTGRIGDLNIGILDVATEAVDDLPVKNLAVARLSLNVQEESTLGMIATFGDPRTAGDNAVLGFDHNYRTRNFLDGKNLRISSFILASLNSPQEGEGSEELGYSYGTQISYPNDLVDASLAFWEFSSKLRPALGFVRRTGVRRLFADLRYRPRPGGAIRRFQFRLRPDVYWRTDDGGIESLNFRVVPIGMLFESGDEFNFTLRARRERLLEPFEISEGVVLPVGDRSWRRAEIRFESSEKRPLSVDMSFAFGGFYDGERRDYRVTLDWRMAPGLSLQTEFQRNEVQLDAGDFDTNLVRFRLGVDFSPELSWNTFAQYDDVSASFGINSRVRWIIEPGKELFFVINQGFSTESDDGRFSLRALKSELSVKVAWTLRF